MTKPFPDTHHDASSNTIFGFWLYLMTDCILFATFFAVYAVLHGRIALNLPLALAQTLILLTSSFTCAARNKMVFWFSITFLLGFAFLFLQWTEFSRLIAEGNTWQKSGALSAFFTLAGVHGLHIIAGLLMMIVFICQLLKRGLTTTVLRRLTCLRMYWQFVYLIWIFTFAIVYLMGAK